MHVTLDSSGNNQGHICGSHFSHAEAAVICKQLNYKDGVALTPGSHSDGSVYKVLVEDIKCPEGGASLLDCYMRLKNGKCDTGPAVVQCYSDGESSKNSYTVEPHLSGHLCSQSDRLYS